MNISHEVKNESKTKTSNTVAIFLRLAVRGIYTESRKKRNLTYSIRMYWMNIWQLTIHEQQDIFEKSLIEVGSSHLYASFGTFCTQICQLFETQWHFEFVWKSTNRCHRREMSPISAIFQMFKVSLSREYLTNLDAKYAKISVRLWTTNYYKSFVKH